ncbi:MAG TPA: P-type conjugative transfer protein TrbL [Oligoflexia bacterium]|nr:P-type conjugative transfer protein TrbL [Oligoflexia bacterium]HMP49138.1 P-type conjugative transfer protein TrbL [Oligoflexia bacterium]
MNLPSLTNALNFFGQVFDNGRDALTGQATSLFQILVLFEIIFSGLYLTLGSGADFKGIARKLLAIGFFSWIIQNYAWLLQQVIDGFILVGQRAGSSSGITFATIQDPDLIFIRGLQLTKPAIDKLFQVADSSYLSILSPDALLLMVCIFCSVFAFGIMAIQIFVTYLEFLIVTTAGFIFIPFGVFKPTAFLAERIFGTIIGFGVKLMILALIIAISDQFLQTIALPPEVTWQQAFEFVIIAFALCFLSLHAPSVTLSLLSGSPNLTFGTVVSTGAASAYAGTKALGTATGVTTGAGKLLGGGATSIAGAVTGGVRSNWSNSREKNSSTISSVASAATGMVTGPLKAAASNVGEKVMWGKDGGPNGQVRYRASIGDESLSAGNRNSIMGKFNSGLYSVPSYRKVDSKARQSKSLDNSKNRDSKEKPNLNDGNKEKKS